MAGGKAVTPWRLLCGSPGQMAVQRGHKDLGPQGLAPLFPSPVASGESFKSSQPQFLHL